MVRGAKWTALYPTVSCHWEDLATAGPGAVLRKCWPARRRITLQGEGRGPQPASEQPGLLGLVSSTRLPSSPPCLTAATSSSHSRPLLPFLNMLLTYHSILGYTHRSRKVANVRVMFLDFHTGTGRKGSLPPWASWLDAWLCWNTFPISVDGNVTSPET